MGKRKIKEMPKKSKMITGYIIYASEIRREIIKANPGKDFGDISKIVGVEWRKLGQEEKVMFEKRAEEQNSLFRDEFTKMSEIANEALANAVAAAAAASGVAPELDKLADVAAERAANEETQQQLQQQQQQQQHQQQGSFMGSQQQTQAAQQQQADGSFASNGQQDSFMSTNHQQQEHAFLSGNQEQQQAQSQLRSPLPSVMSQYANSVANYNAAAYSQQSAAYYSQLMMGAQGAPSLMRPNAAVAAAYSGAGSATPTDLLLQQQHQQQPPSSGVTAAAAAAAAAAMPQQVPFSLVQHSQPTTTVQYCNNPACCASGRYQPYPTYPYSPPEPPVTPSSVHQQGTGASSPPIKLSPTHQASGPHQQSHQQQQQPSHSHIQQQQHLFKMNNIIYRKPSLVKLRPRDVGTQTDPVLWGASRTELESPKKQQLRYSKEFIQYLRGGLQAGTPAKITAECHW